MMNSIPALGWGCDNLELGFDIFKIVSVYLR